MTAVIVRLSKSLLEPRASVDRRDNTMGDKNDYQPGGFIFTQNSGKKYRDLAKDPRIQEK